MTDDDRTHPDTSPAAAHRDPDATTDNGKGPVPNDDASPEHPRDPNVAPPAEDEAARLGDVA